MPSQCEERSAPKWPFWWRIKEGVIEIKSARHISQRCKFHLPPSPQLRRVGKGVLFKKIDNTLKIQTVKSTW